MKRRIVAVAVAMVMAAGWTGAARADVALVVEGQAVADIVLATNAPQALQRAAADLQQHVARMSGATLAIVPAPLPELSNHVYVGTSAFTEQLGFRPVAFTSSGFEILATGRHVIVSGPDRLRSPSPYEQTREDSEYLNGSVIAGNHRPKPANFPSAGLKAWQEFCGHKFTTMHLNNHLGGFNPGLGLHSNDDPGTWYAVAELLEQLGVRWYMPYEDGTVVPERRTVTVREQHLKKQAAFDRREWCFYGAMRSDAEGLAWLKRLKAGNWNSILYNHTTYAIYSSYEQQQLHPEYLACDAQGKPYGGYPSGRGMPRYTEPGFRAAAATYMNKVFDTFPELTAMTVGPPDGGVRMDARDVDRYGTPEDSLEQKTSRYVWDFHVFLAGELKKAHPGKRLIYMTGAGGREVPSRIDAFPDNLIVPLRGYSPAHRVLETTRHEIEIADTAWRRQMKSVPRAPLWNYFLWYRTPSHPRYPVIFTAALQEEMREILPVCDGKFIEIQPEIHKPANGAPFHRLNTPGLIHLMVYLQNKLFWDPALDREALLNEYFTLFFGPAAEAMKVFHADAEAVWMRQESRSVTPTTGFLKEADVDRFFAELAAARQAAGAGSVYDRRIALMEKEMQPLKTLFPNLKRTGPLVRAYLAPAKPVIDGDLTEYQHGWVALAESRTGNKVKKNGAKAVIAMTPDRSALIVGVVCMEDAMAQVKAVCNRNDERGIFEDDVVEVYVDTPRRSYFKVVVNPNGAIWDETTDVAIIERDTLPILWNPGVKAAVRKEADRWSVEILIPAGDFGDMGPTQDVPWGLQIGRTRFAGGALEAFAIAPTLGEPYKTQNRWARLWMR